MVGVVDFGLLSVPRCFDGRLKSGRPRDAYSYVVLTDRALGDQSSGDTHSYQTISIATTILIGRDKRSK
jgi:hypothetical protein